MTTELLELADCPFCGGGEHCVDEKTYWTGMRSELLNVTVRHWCERIEGQPQSLIQITRKTRNEAITAWNTRALASRAGVPDGWVAVTDRLPDPYQDVEVYPSWDDDTSNTYCPHDGGTNGRKAGNWYHNDREGYDHEMDVTHWRPRAKPPAAPEPVAVGAALAPGCGDGVGNG